MRVKNRLVVSGLAAFVALAGSASFADDAVVLKVALKGHRFVPAELIAPVGKPLEIEVTNMDPTESEFESKTLRFEEVVAGNGKGHDQGQSVVARTVSFFRRLLQGNDAGVAGGPLIAAA